MYLDVCVASRSAYRKLGVGFGQTLVSSYWTIRVMSRELELGKILVSVWLYIRVASFWTQNCGKLGSGIS